MTSPAYERLADAIANVILGLSHDDGAADGMVRYTHYCENNLHAPCDMLLRLGVMSDAPGGMEHVFRPDWVTGKDKALIRHPGEPVMDDLYLALKFYVEWFPKTVSRSSFDAARAQPSLPSFSGDFRTPRREAFFEWAMQCVVQELIEADAGNWNAEGYFVLAEPFGSYRGLEEYWRGRAQLVQQFAGDESRLFPSATG